MCRWAIHLFFYPKILKTAAGEISKCHGTKRFKIVPRHQDVVLMDLDTRASTMCSVSLKMTFGINFGIELYLEIHTHLIFISLMYGTFTTKVHFMKSICCCYKSRTSELFLLGCVGLAWIGMCEILGSIHFLVLTLKLGCWISCGCILFWWCNANDNLIIFKFERTSTKHIIVIFNSQFQPPQFS